MSELIHDIPTASMQEPAQLSYFQKRMTALGITPAINQVQLLVNDPDGRVDDKGVKWHASKLQSFPVFKAHDRGIEIITYSIDRHFNFYHDPEKLNDDGRLIQKKGQNKKWSVIRLEKPIVKDNGDIIKYLMPKGHGSCPLYSPNILDAYENKTDIHTLVLTEGFFKCWKGYMAGLHIIGLPSITHMKDKEKKAIHPEIIQIIERCNVRHIIWLTDGDAVDISKETETKDAAGNKQLKDLYRRPYGFYASVNTFSQLLYDYRQVKKYYAYIDTHSIISNHPDQYSRDDVKGLDDLLLAFPDKNNEIIDDLQQVSKPGQWFNKFDVSVHAGKVWEHFHLDNPTRFYLFHLERRPDIKGNDFVFHGTQYHYNETSGECDIVVPARAKDYFRVGDDYYKHILVPNKYGNKEKTFKGRRKGTIIDDHSKNFVQHIPRYESFCNVPSHINFQRVIDNCFNVYNPLDYQPDEDTSTPDDCPTIMAYLHHVFGDRIVNFTNPKTKSKHEYKNIDLALDYLQLLYKMPAEKLPILCLVSKENNTGKSTFGFLLRAIFGSNTAIVGNQDLAGDFNAHWATKLLVIVDETKIDKQHVVEKVKSLSTANKITMNAKGKDHVEIDCFIKFIFITNNEENFIFITDEDIRYWVIKVPVIREENPSLLNNMVEEIPAFLSYLSNRILVTEQLNRMWFHPTIIKTEAMKKVIENSRPTIQKEIREQIRDMFLDFGPDEILMTAEDIRKEFFKGKFERNYVKKTLSEEMKLDVWHVEDPTVKDMFGNSAKIYKPRRYSYPRWDEVYKDGSKQVVRVDVECNGRPYVFHRQHFLTADEITHTPPDEKTKYENQIASTQPGLYDNTGADDKSELPF